MKKLLCKLLSKFLVVTILISNSPVFALQQANNHYLTRGEAAQRIASAADNQWQNVRSNDLLRGYEDGTKRAERPVTRAEAMVMTERAFGPFPLPNGDLKRRGIFTGNFKNFINGKTNRHLDLPEWAVDDIRDLGKTGILMPEEESNLFGNSVFWNDTMTKAELEQILKRLYAYLGNNIKDDAYNTVNRLWLTTAKIPSGERSQSAFAELEQENNLKIKRIIEECVDSNPQKGTDEQKIADLYRSCLDDKPREKKGIKPLKSYFRAIDKPRTVDELLDVEAALEENLGVHFLLPWFIIADAKDSSTNRLALTGQISNLAAAEYLQSDENVRKAYEELLRQALILAGENQQQTAKQAKKIYEFEKTIAKASLREDELNDVKKTYHAYSQEKLAKLFTGCDIRRALARRGFGQVDKIIVYDEGAVKALAGLLENQNLETLKNKLKVYIILCFSDTLPKNCDKMLNKFQQQAYGVVGAKTKEEKAVALVRDTFYVPLGKLYIQRYFSKDAKDEIEQMAAQCVDVYETALTENEWLSGKTKKMALKKLQAIHVKVGYPDLWDHSLDSVTISSRGKNLFENMAAVKKAWLQKEKESVDRPVNQEEWSDSVFTVNAYYMPTRNEIVFPAGILQSPFYDENQTRAANLGGIGTVIAHEITHAFDNHGAMYDENGNAYNWWTAEDYAKFNLLCEEVKTFYDGVEAAPGIANDGTLTLSENVADLGGVSCALSVLEQERNGTLDYRTFFRSFLRLWPKTMPRETMTYYRNTDVHSLAAVRANQTVQNFQQFYDAFHISDGDGMYILPAKRVKIW